MTTMTTIITLLAGNTAVAMMLAAAAWTASRARRPALAHVAWLLVLVKLLTPPLCRVPVMSTEPVADGASIVAPSVVTTVMPPIAAIAEATSGPDIPIHGDRAAAIDDMTPAVLERADAVPPMSLEPAPAISLDWSRVGLLVWMLGAGGMAMIAVIRVMRFRRLLKTGSPAPAGLAAEVQTMAADIGIARAPQVVMVAAPVSPLLWFAGIGCPRLVLPAALLASMTAGQRAGVIAHELAHLHRRDHWVRLLELPATVLLWFHPLVWIARRGLREAEEQCCDAWAVSMLPAGRRAYADALVNAMARISGFDRLPVGATGLGRIESLRRRVTMIVTQSPPRSLSFAGRLAALALLAAVVVAPVRGEAEPAKAVGDVAVRDASITVAPGQSLQAAIDKASDGATITLAEGVYPETITITRPIALVGAGWDKTTIGPDKTATSFTQEQKDEFFRRLEAATDAEQRARIALAMAAVTVPPTLTVKDAAGVMVRGLRVRGPYTGQPGSVRTNETLVQFDNATGAIMSGCAVVGPSSNGVSIVNGSDVRIEKSLIAGVWGTGVQVYAGERGGDRAAKPAKVHVVDSDVRNCHHRCVTISGEGSVIERSRISGSAWHGIRYDHCSPTVKSNLLFDNARFGIYASGKTAAAVEGNVFWRNAMEGMSCWFNNADDVTRNTFVDNLRGGVGVLGNSTTTFTKNLFVDNPIGVAYSQVSGEAATTPKFTLTGNVFWDNAEDYQVLGKPAPLPAGNEKAEPKFVAATKQDFALALDSSARKLGAGAADPIPFASPFAIQPGEQAIIPDGETRDYQHWKHNPPSSAAADGQLQTRLAAAQAGPATGKTESGVTATDKQRERQRQFAKARMRQDTRRFSKDQVAEAEELYQVANKNWRSPEAAASLKTMIEKFPEMNRTGCAVLYLGQWSRGEEREQYLKRAVEKHSDCYYGNGTQVGGFARYLLGHDYREQGKTAEAEKLFNEIRENYPEAITHRGDLLVAVLREEAKGTRKPSTATQPAQ